MSQNRPASVSKPAVGDKADNKRRSGKSGDGAERYDFIYRSISNAIIEHRLKPGGRLREDALADVFGVSRTGIRTILQRLALEQLVTLTPRRGASVTRPTAAEAKDVFAARQIIECGLMPRVSQRITAADVDELRDLARREKEALRAGEQSTAIKLSAAFHEGLASLSGNDTLIEFVSRLCSRSSLILAVYGRPGYLGCESHDHDELIQLLEQGDGEGASVFMSQHLSAIEASLVFIEEPDETPDLHRIFAN